MDPWYMTACVEVVCRRVFALSFHFRCLPQYHARKSNLKNNFTCLIYMSDRTETRLFQVILKVQPKGFWAQVQTFATRYSFLLRLLILLLHEYYECLLSMSDKPSRGKKERRGGSSMSLFTLQERNWSGAEGTQILAQAVWVDTTLNLHILPLIST